MTKLAQLPYLSFIDVRECGYAFGTVCVELVIRNNGKLIFIDQHLVNLIKQMADGVDTRSDVLDHLNGNFSRLISQAMEAAGNDPYIRRHLNSIKGPFSIS